MADPVNNAPNPANPAAPKAEPAKAELPALDLSKISGAEASALVAQAKAENKSIEQVYAERQAAQGGRSAPKPQSNQEAVKEAAQEAKRKLKIDNEEVDEDEVLKVYKARKSHQQAANKELQEGKTLRKQAEEFISMMRDPEKVKEVMTKLGYTKEQLRAMSEKILVAELEDEMLDPREKELRETKAKLKRHEDFERQQQEQIEQKRLQEMRDKYQKEFSEQFVSALKDSGLPPTKPMVAEMAKYISRSAKIGFKMTPQEAAQLVKEDITLAHQRLIGDTDGEMLIKLLGENVANKIRQYDTSKLKDPNQNLRTPQHQAPQEDRRDRSAPKKRMTAQEWRLHKLGKK